MSKRRTTVYDLSALNLRPDGSHSSKISGPSRPRAHIDSRGNWIAAQDAFRVPKSYYKHSEGLDDTENEQEDFDFGGVDLSHTRRAKGKERELTPEADAHGRSAKRRKVAHDFNFIEETLPDAPQRSEERRVGKEC